jgi:hypothetical protein
MGTLLYNSVKVKVPHNRPESPEVGRGIPLLFLDLGARSGWVVSTKPRPPYPRERPGTHCTGGWVGLRAGLDVCEKSRPYRDFFILILSYRVFSLCSTLLLFCVYPFSEEAPIYTYITVKRSINTATKY